MSVFNYLFCKGVVLTNDKINKYNIIGDNTCVMNISTVWQSPGLTEIDRSTFDYHCHKCGIDPKNFTQEDLDRLKNKLIG